MIYYTYLKINLSTDIVSKYKAASQESEVNLIILTSSEHTKI